VLELGRAIASLCGATFEPEMSPKRAGEVQRIAIDSSRARDELGWGARVSLGDGLQSTVDSFRS
jgi:UDP-glucose 4-epimerase